MEEIKAGDIMLNNWFHVNGYPMYVDSIFRDTVYLEFEGNEGDVWEENIKDLKPIPLTEDILLKAGCTKETEDDKYGRVFLIPNTRYIIRIVNYGNPWNEDFGFSLELPELKDDPYTINIRTIGKPISVSTWYIRDEYDIQILENMKGCEWKPIS